MSEYIKNLQENMVARLCHDLANDLGSLQLGLDNLIDVSKRNKNKDPLHEKITEGLKRSTASALAKHAFYRMAYGNSSGLEESQFIDLKKIIDKFNSHIDLNFTFEPEHNNRVMRAEQAKLFLNLYGLCAEMMPYGGQIHLKSGEQPTFELHAQEIIRFNKEAPLNPRTVHFHYCKGLAEAAGLILVQGDGNPVLLSLEKKV